MSICLLAKLLLSTLVLLPCRKSWLLAMSHGDTSQQDPTTKQSDTSLPSQVFALSPLPSPGRNRPSPTRQTPSSPSSDFIIAVPRPTARTQLSSSRATKPSMIEPTLSTELNSMSPPSEGQRLTLRGGRHHDNSCCWGMFVCVTCAWLCWLD